MTPENVADATAELLARIALLLDRRGALALGELLPIVEAFAVPSENPALPAIAARVSARLRSIDAAKNRRSARAVLDASGGARLSATPWQSHTE
jgi:hypothetical protein